MPCVRGKSGSLQHNGPPDPQRALSLVFTAASKEIPRNRRPGRRLATSPCGARSRTQALPSFRGHDPGVTRSRARRGLPAHKYDACASLADTRGPYCAARPTPAEAICARSSRTLAPCSTPQRFRRGSRASSPSIEPPSRSRKGRIRASSKEWTGVSMVAPLAHQIGAPPTKSQAAAVSATAAQRNREKLESTAPENRPPCPRVSATAKIDLVAKRVARPPPNQRARANLSKISPIHGCVTRSTRRNLALAPPP